VCKNHKAPLRNDNYSQEGPQYLCKFTRNWEGINYMYRYCMDEKTVPNTEPQWASSL
jgi:hypothetical protein